MKLFNWFKRKKSETLNYKIMSEQEIEKEVQARVEFKMNELLTGVKNRVGFKYKQAFDMTQKSQYIWQAWEELEGMVKKEVAMATPYSDMDKRKKWEAKEKAVDNITKSLDLRGRQDYQHKVKVIVSEIENAQNY